MLEDGIGKSAGDPERFPIRCYPDSVRGGAGSTFGDAKATGLIWQLNSGHLGALGEIHNRESLKSRQLDKDAACRTIWVRFEGHGAHGAVELDFPYCLLGVEIDNRGCFAFYRTADRIPAVTGDEHVVDAAMHANAVHSFEGSCVDHIDDAWLRPDAYQHPASIPGDGKVVRPGAQRHFLEDFPALSIHDVEHALRFIADVDSRPVGRESDAMRQLYAPYHLHDCVRRGINHVDRIASAVGDIDPSCRSRRPGRRTCANTAHPVSHGQPVEIVLRQELPAARMERIPSRFGREWMDQKPARSGISGNNLLKSALEVAPRLVVSPIRATR